MVSIIFDVHLVQASFCRRVFHSDGAILIVGDVRTGSSTGRHSHFTWRTKHKQSLLTYHDTADVSTNKYCVCIKA